jgi:pteridine reductase
VHYHGSEGGARVTADAITAGGGTAELFGADLTRAGAPAALVRAVVARMGSVDVLVNSAAIMQRTPWRETTEDQWDAMFALNLRAPFFLTQAAAIAMGEQGGAVVNIADLAAFETWPAYVPHGITKSGVVQMTRALARILAPAVRVNAVAPGTVLLPDDWSSADAARLAATTPLARLGDPGDVVQAVRYLLEADYVTGETLIVDGGRHVRC